ncbi:MAG: hypothetical protein E7280_00055 [Lachnospiraceae bacterium]|jgi:hypothetical protein|nr:hypothetical protein [Lachnospiraceae bacterium]
MLRVMESDFTGLSLNHVDFRNEYDNWFETEKVYNMEGNMNPFHLEPPVEEKKIRRIAASAASQLRKIAVSLNAPEAALRVRNA